MSKKDRVAAKHRAISKFAHELDRKKKRAAKRKPTEPQPVAPVKMVMSPRAHADLVLDSLEKA